jgi:outer membrane protein OmpA-like peptidoglycan-associated protein
LSCKGYFVFFGLAKKLFMKTNYFPLLFCAAMLLLYTSVNSQVLKGIGDKIKKTAQKDTKKKDTDVDTTRRPEGETKTDSDDKSNSSSSSMTFNSKYDFVPGEKVVGFEDFSKAEIGDFPTRWNTNATAEVVTLNNKEGKWLKIAKEGVFHPEFITNLPDNFTFEFDLAVNPDWRGTHFAVNLANLSKPQEFTDYYHYVTYRGKYAVHMELKPGLSGRTSANSRLQAASDGNYAVNNDVDFKVWDNADKNFVHISMWRQGQRLRVYANGEKIWDVPRAFDATSKFNAVTFGMQGSYGPEDYMLLGNIRMAIGAADTRNKLITEGKFVTRGILFDVNSDKIKPESSGALKDIANVLKENAGVKVKIVGHTDSDGDDKSNLTLSEKRAAAVKNHLVKEYGISDANLTTEGKGESQLVDKNPTPEGKANNRRVEFIKM